MMQEGAPDGAEGADILAQPAPRHASGGDDSDNTSDSSPLAKFLGSYEAREHVLPHLGLHPIRTLRAVFRSRGQAHVASMPKKVKTEMQQLEEAQDTGNEIRWKFLASRLTSTPNLAFIAHHPDRLGRAAERNRLYGALSVARGDLALDKCQEELKEYKKVYTALALKALLPNAFQFSPECHVGPLNEELNSFEIKFDCPYQCSSDLRALVRSVNSLKRIGLSVPSTRKEILEKLQAFRERVRRNTRNNCDHIKDLLCLAAIVELKRKDQQPVDEHLTELEEAWDFYQKDYKLDTTVARSHDDFLTIYAKRCILARYRPEVDRIALYQELEAYIKANRLPLREIPADSVYKRFPSLLEAFCTFHPECTINAIDLLGRTLSHVFDSLYNEGGQYTHGEFTTQHIISLKSMLDTLTRLCKQDSKYDVRVHKFLLRYASKLFEKDEMCYSYLLSDSEPFRVADLIRKQLDDLCVVQPSLTRATYTAYLDWIAQLIQHVEAGTAHATINRFVVGEIKEVLHSLHYLVCRANQQRETGHELIRRFKSNRFVIAALHLWMSENANEHAAAVPWALPYLEAAQAHEEHSGATQAQLREAIQLLRPHEQAHADIMKKRIKDEMKQLQEAQDAGDEKQQEEVVSRLRSPSNLIFIADYPDCLGSVEDWNRLCEALSVADGAASSKRAQEDHYALARGGTNDRLIRALEGPLANLYERLSFDEEASRDASGETYMDNLRSHIACVNTLEFIGRSVPEKRKEIFKKLRECIIGKNARSILCFLACNKLQPKGSLPDSLQPKLQRGLCDLQRQFKDFVQANAPSSRLLGNYARQCILAQYLSPEDRAALYQELEECVKKAHQLPLRETEYDSLYALFPYLLEVYRNFYPERSGDDFALLQQMLTHVFSSLYDQDGQYTHGEFTDAHTRAVYEMLHMIGTLCKQDARHAAEAHAFLLHHASQLFEKDERCYSYIKYEFHAETMAQLTRFCLNELCAVQPSLTRATYTAYFEWIAQLIQHVEAEKANSITTEYISKNIRLVLEDVHELVCRTNQQEALVQDLQSRFPSNPFVIAALHHWVADVRAFSPPQPDPSVALALASWALPYLEAEQAHEGHSEVTQAQLGEAIQLLREATDTGEAEA